MSFFDAIAKWLGLNEAPSADSRAGAAGAVKGAGTGAAAADTGFGAPAEPGPGALGTNSPYTAMWQSVDRHLAQFMVHSVLPHRQFEPDDVFDLVRIQIAGTTPAAERAIAQFLAEFRPESRRKAVLAAVRRQCAQGVSVDGFVDFNRDFERAALDASDPYDAQLAEAHQAGYQLTLYGEWALQRPVAPAAPVAAAAAAPTTSPTTARPDPAPLELALHDANGARRIPVTELPCVLGRSGGAAGVGIAGRFVSRRHGVLERDLQGRVWYRETSVNGSSVDGVAIAAGERRQLRNGARLRLGGDATAALADCPELVVQWPAGADDDDAHTPLRAGLDAATPLAAPATPLVTAPITPPSTPPPGPLCLLAVKDALGSRTVPVTRLPWVIGRGDQADCRVPEANAGVSREHLVLRALDAAGAQFEHPAADKWGTELDGAEQGDRFTLGWGRQLTLASRFAKAPPVTVLLLPASE